MVPPVYIESAALLGVLGVQAEINPAAINTISALEIRVYIFISTLDSVELPNVELRGGATQWRSPA